jgi:hypothetical protein
VQVERRRARTGALAPEHRQAVELVGVLGDLHEGSEDNV